MSPRGARRRDDPALLHRIGSILLRYPDPAVLAALDDVAAALPALRGRTDRVRLTALTGRLRALPPLEAEAAYVAAFDHSRRRSLYLTYHRHGDTRGRGMALLALRQRYRRAGHEPPQDELPDFLPLVLEFASLAPQAGRQVLLQYRIGLEALRQALRERDDPYAAVLDAVCGRLPVLGPRGREALHQLSAEGPPREEVGLEPVGPPPVPAAPQGPYPSAPASGRAPEPSAGEPR